MKPALIYTTLSLISFLAMGKMFSEKLFLKVL